MIHNRNPRRFYPAIAIVLLALALLLAILLPSLAAADGPVIWKMHCPYRHEIQIVPDAQGDGVHALCIMQSAAAEK